MKKHSTYVGMDCGDRRHRCVVVDSAGREVARMTLRNRDRDVREGLRAFPQSLVALEVGTHSRWLQRVLEAAGHSVVVANARRLPAITQSAQKTDWRDAQMLARLVRFDPALLFAVQHRGVQAQRDLAVLKARDAVVRVRTTLINAVRGLLKSEGARAPSCYADAFAKQTAKRIPAGLAPALRPLLEAIAQLTDRIHHYDRAVAALAQRHPEVDLLREVTGVGPLTSMGYVLTLEDPHRFASSRKVGAYVGLVPRKDQSGDVDKELRITKHGDEFVRRLLVNAAQYILGPLNQKDSALRQFGLRLAQGGTRAKKRAVVAVARKLAVLLHHLWVTGESYEPFPERRRGHVV